MSQKELKILPYSFIECTQLTKITIPSYVKKIGNSAFEYCCFLNEVDFANDSKLLFISNYAFMGCTKLQQITIPSSVRLIGYSAFHECNSLKEITIPPSVLLIGSCAFAYCSSLKQISYSSETKILDDAFFKCSLESNNSYEITKLNEFENSLRTFISEITTNEKINHFENISEDKILNELLNIYSQRSNKENTNNEDYQYYQNEICHDLTVIFYNPSFDVNLISLTGEHKCIQVKNTETIDSLKEKISHLIRSHYFELMYNVRVLFSGTIIRNYGIKKGSTIKTGIR